MYISILFASASNKNIRNLSIGVQNISAFSDGAYTGEASFEMCEDFNSKYFLVSLRKTSNTRRERCINLKKVSRLLKHNKK